MKLVRYSAPDGEERFGVWSKGKATDLTPSYGGFADLVADAGSLKAARAGEPVDESRLLPPVDRRSKVLCMAVNYYSHIKEMKSDRTKVPILFPKYYQSLTGPYSKIRRFSISEIMDYEGEIAIVIGKRAHNVRRRDAWSHVLGCTILNDMSARSLFRVPQGKGNMLDWFSCKAIDSSTPVGPWVVTMDEAGPFASLGIQTFLNGSKVQSSSASDMVFDVPKIVEHASSRVALDPGDLISTGTPSGVGVGRGRTLQKGDVVKVQVKGIGRLENMIV
jgi:2-keto-4-pentenoate hydratase/2-oxohepta-3-ene-1,7-dioic acid hydratase in catechol pathway